MFGAEYVECEIEFFDLVSVDIAGDAGFDKVDVCKGKRLEVGDKMGELRNGVGHFHGLEEGEGGETDGDAGGGDDRCDSFGYFEGEARAGRDGSTPGIWSVLF